MANSRMFKTDRVEKWLNIPSKGLTVTPYLPHSTFIMANSESNFDT